MTTQAGAGQLDPGSAEADPAQFLTHLPALDGLRGIAILLVVAHNFSTDGFESSLMGRLVEAALHLGWTGVQLFFVLSGFLITRILLQTQGAPNYFSAFFGRRILRIFPLYYGTLFVALVVLPLLGDVPPALAYDQRQQVWLWLYLSNWVGLLNFDSQVFPHFWSLAIEGQFYLLWPLLLYRRDARRVLSLCMAIAVTSLGLRAAMLWYGADVESVYTYTFYRTDALALGSAIAAWLRLPGSAERVFARRHVLASGAVAMWIFGLLVTHGYPRASPLVLTLGYSWLACTFAVTVAAAACCDRSRPTSMWNRALSVAPLRTLGKYSYGMYVFHKPLHDWVGRPLLVQMGLLEHPSSSIALAYLAIATLITLAAAMLSYHLYERHFLALKRLFVAESSPATARGLG